MLYQPLDMLCIIKIFTAVQVFSAWFVFQVSGLHGNICHRTTIKYFHQIIKSNIFGVCRLARASASTLNCPNRAVIVINRVLILNETDAKSCLTMPFIVCRFYPSKS